jgi:hypothetical protein
MMFFVSLLDNEWVINSAVIFLVLFFAMPSHGNSGLPPCESEFSTWAELERLASPSASTAACNKQYNHDTSLVAECRGHWQNELSKKFDTSRNKEFSNLRMPYCSQRAQAAAFLAEATQHLSSSSSNGDIVTNLSHSKNQLSTKIAELNQARSKVLNLLGEEGQGGIFHYCEASYNKIQFFENLEKACNNYAKEILSKIDEKIAEITTIQAQLNASIAQLGASAQAPAGALTQTEVAAAQIEEIKVTAQKPPMPEVPAPAPPASASPQPPPSSNRSDIVIPNYNVAIDIAPKVQLPPPGLDVGVPGTAPPRAPSNLGRNIAIGTAVVGGAVAVGAVVKNKSSGNSSSKASAKEYQEPEPETYGLPVQEGTIHNNHQMMLNICSNGRLQDCP